MRCPVPTGLLSAVLVAFAASAEGAPAPFPKAARSHADLPRVQGEWVAVSYQARSGSGAPGNPKEVTVRFDGRTLTVMQFGRPLHSGAVALARSGAVGRIDYTREKTRAIGIYRLQGGTLTVCWRYDGVRPTSFAFVDAESDQELFTLERR